jgi:ParB-like chromosome segregation protein Spo0J
MPELRIETVDIDELNLNPLNSKLHPAEQIDQIAASIEQFGNCDPLGVWTNDDGELVIVEGHGRYAALRKLGINKVPIIRLDHLSDEQRRAYGIIHNKLTMNSDFDFELLMNELDMVTDIDMSDYGFDFDLQSSFSEDYKENQNEQYEKDYSDTFTDILGVFITCKVEAEQQRIYEEILKGGYECRLLTL